MATKITVQTDAGGASYDDADGWTVDDRGDLHILKKDADKRSTIATHAHGHWTSVARTTVPEITYRANGIDPERVAAAIAAEVAKGPVNHPERH